MPYRLEITLKPELFDAEGDHIRKKAGAYLGLEIDSVRTVHILTIDAELSNAQLETLRTEIFTNPVTQVSSFTPLDLPFDLMIWVGLRPGVRDNAGATAVEAIEDVLGMRLGPGGTVYTSRRYAVTGRNLAPAAGDAMAGELLANGIVQQWRVFTPDTWQPDTGVGLMLPKVTLNHTPTVSVIPVDSDAHLLRVSAERNLALNPADVPVIRRYFQQPGILADRASVGLAEPTDVELEYISQARSDHCNHNTFRGRFHYTDLSTNESRMIDNLFKTCIQQPTRSLQEKKPWVISVLWDNAGAARIDDDHHYVITGETHNSPSNMEAYGGAITGIVGVYRDPMGTGKGARLIMGSYGFCVGPRDYAGPLRPHLHPRRLLDGVIEGVRDGGNKSGIPTTFGQVTFHPGYMGKCLVFVTAVGIMPATVGGRPSEEKTTRPGELIVMCGGRLGKDGIHGVTASAEEFSEHTPAGHVQIGDPYTQKKMHDFLLEARDQGLIRFITDNGGGGLSSSVGESTLYSNGCHVELDKVPLKYEGLDQWEIWVSESQERMTVAVAAEDVEAFMALSRRHAVESTVIGRYTDTGKLHITWKGETCAHVDLDLLSRGFPQWVFEAEWRPPEMRGLTEPAIGEPSDHNRLLCDILARPNVASKEWIVRQYDHEVQGTSVVKPLVGKDRDVPSDAAVIRPVLTSDRGLAFSQALLPAYSAIDAFHMTAATIDEAVRRLVAVGADPDRIGGVDNYCWPNIQFDEKKNPDGKFKAAQLVRSCEALRDVSLAYGIPLLSGKDSMYVDGNLCGAYGETHKVSALETLQFSATGVVEDVYRCMTLAPRRSGHRLYLLGETRDELGASELYAHFGYIGKNVPRVRPEAFREMYRSLSKTISQGIAASVHGIYRGGLAVHLAMMAMACNCGLEVDLDAVPAEGKRSPLIRLYSESAGRMLVSLPVESCERFEAMMGPSSLSCLGSVTDTGRLVITAGSTTPVVDLSVNELKSAWKKPFGGLS